jgi:hypothetical protein
MATALQDGKLKLNCSTNQPVSSARHPGGPAAATARFDLVAFMADIDGGTLTALGVIPDNLLNGVEDGD